MKPSLRVSIFFLTLSLLVACSPARTGVVDGTLTTNMRPAMEISANTPFVLADSGRVWTQPRTDMMTPVANASFDYAVYTDPAVSPAQRMAYAAIIRLEDRTHWMFLPQGASLPGAFGGRKASPLLGREGDVQNLCVVSEGDWTSDLLTANGTTPPAMWLAKRWVFALDQEVRAMAEYREPWPEGLEKPEVNIALLRDKDAQYIRAFEQRALEVFNFTADSGCFSSSPPLVGKWVVPRKSPDVATLAGEIKYLENGNGDNSSYE